MKKDKTLHDKIVVVTGASSGAGRAVAEELALHGATLILAARNRQNLDEVVRECAALGGTAIAHVTDVKEADDVVKLAAETAAQYGRIDVWINNAGVLAAGEFDHTPMDVHEDVIRTNLLGYMHGAHAVLPYFKRQNAGILINNISVGGFLPVPYGTAYSASKFGLRGFSEALQAELSTWKNIHVCDLFPAFLDTPGIRHAANFTGKVLKPAPPVYDPRRVARAAYHRILHPASTTYVGSASPLLRIAHALAPKLMTQSTGFVMRSYFRSAKSIRPGSGNVLDTLDFGSGIYGGHGLPGAPKAHRKYLTAAVAAFALASFFLVKKAAGS